MKNRISYVDGLKGVACVFVMIGHMMWGTLYGNTTAPEYQPAELVVFLMRNTPLSIIGSGNFLVLVFCMLNGWLARFKSVNKVKDLVCSLLKGWLMWSLMIFLGGCVIYGLERTVGFRNAEVAAILGDYRNACNWYKEPLSIKHIFKESFVLLWTQGSAKITGVLWMMKYLFWGSVIAKVLSYIMEVLGNRIAFCFMLPVLVVVGMKCDYIIWATVMGVFLYECQQRLDGKCKSGIIFVILLPVFLYLASSEAVLLYCRTAFPKYWGVVRVGFTFIFLLLLILSARMRELFSNKILQGLGKICFEIYLFHIPVYCALVCPIFLKIYDKINYTVCFFICTGLDVIFTILISMCFHSAYQMIRKGRLFNK